MRLTEYFIRRPVASVVLSLLIFFSGLLCVFYLPLRLHPQIVFPVVTVNTSYPGASASTMESAVTTPLESSLSFISGISYITSSSSNSNSQIYVHFRLGSNINDALLSVMNGVSYAMPQLPQNAYQPTVRKVDSSLYSVAILSVTNPKISPLKLTTAVKNITIPSLSTIQGVGGVFQRGGIQPQIWITLNPLLMTANNISASDVMGAVHNYNVLNVTGDVRNDKYKYAVMANTEISTVKAFEDIVVRHAQGKNIYLKDVATVTDNKEPLYNLAFVNGKSGIAVYVNAKFGANDLDVYRAIEKSIPALMKQLPKGTQIKTIFNGTNYIKNSLLNTLWALIAAVIIVILVVLIFLGSIRLIFVPLIALPVSIVGVCSLMLIFGYSLNIFTLLAFILAIGLVVDDAIIVAERIFVHFSKKRELQDSALRTMKELKSAIVVMTLTLIVVYIPVAFARGITGQLFSSFCITLAGSVILSGIVALTLSPMLCAKFLPNEFVNVGFWQAKTINFFNTIKNSYKHLLAWLLKLRWLMIVVVIVIYVASYFIQASIPRALIPQENKGYFSLVYHQPIVTSSRYVARQAVALSKKLLSIPDVKTVIMQTYPGASQAYVLLKPRSQRKLSALELINKYRTQFDNFKGGRAVIYNPSALPLVSSNVGEFSIELTTPGSYQELREAAEVMRDKMQQWPGVKDVFNTLKFNTPQFNITPDRQKTDYVGTSPMDISNIVNLLLTQQRVGFFSKDGYYYSVHVQVDDKYQYDIEAIKIFPVLTKAGSFIPLSSVAKIEQTAVPQSLNHFQYQRSATIFADLAKGVDQTQALNKAKEIAAKYLPSDIAVKPAGHTRRQLGAMKSLAMLLIAGVVFIYLMMALQFNSFIAPITVLITVPLAFFGGLFCLWLAGGSLNLFTIIGLITLIGLIAKHGILIVTFVQQLRSKGKSLQEAILSAAAIRLRPILMTTAAMSLAAVPLIAIPGEGTNALHQIGWVILGGMLIGTLFSLFVLPCVCMILLPKRKLVNKS